MPLVQAAELSVLVEVLEGLCLLRAHLHCRHRWCSKQRHYLYLYHRIHHREDLRIPSHHHGQPIELIEFTAERLLCTGLTKRQEA